MIRPSGFSPTRVMARQFALCRKCPRGFEGPVVLLWKEIPVCQSCYIKELEAWNAKLNAMADARDGITRIIHGQQAKPSSLLDGGDVPEKNKPADTSQETDGCTIPSRPGVHGPQVADSTASSCAVHEEQRVRLPHSAVSKPVDTQSQDWPNRKAAEVQRPCTFSSPDIDDGREVEGNG